VILAKQNFIENSIFDKKWRHFHIASTGYTDNKFWKNQRKVDAKKQRIFKSIYGGPDDDDEGPSTEKRKKKMNSKRRRKQKEKNLDILDNEEPAAETVAVEEPKPKKQKKHKQKSDREKVQNMPDDRLGAYGMTGKEAKAFKKKNAYTDQTLQY